MSAENNEKENEPQSIWSRSGSFIIASKAFRADQFYDRYCELKHNLRIVTEARKINSEMTVIDAARLSLGEILKFLNSDPEIVSVQAAASLGTLYGALHDLTQGASPKLFKVKKSSGHPSRLHEAGKRAQIVLAINILVNAGFKISDASAWLAGKLKRAGITGKEGEISAKEIKRWRDELGGKSLSGSDEV